MKIQLTTARLTGLFYLGLALTGGFAFLFVKSNIYISDDAVATLTNLAEKETLARWGIAAELALVGFQALAAVWFFKLFRRTHDFAAGLITVFGLVNAVAVLISVAMWWTALNVATAGGAILSPGGDQAATAQLLFALHENIWAVANLFFGLWLIPMGYVARKAGMSKVLAWFLIVGGVGYALSVLAAILLPGQTDLKNILTIPASIGEFWMIGYLLFWSHRNSNLQ